MMQKAIVCAAPRAPAGLTGIGWGMSHIPNGSAIAMVDFQVFQVVGLPIGTDTQQGFLRTQ